jgi:signal transduction histidine kinase
MGTLTENPEPAERSGKTRRKPRGGGSAPAAAEPACDGLHRSLAPAGDPLDSQGRILNVNHAWLDLHDGLGQLLTGLSGMAVALKDRLSASGHPAAEDAAQLAQVAATAMTRTRTLARGLAPLAADERELRAVLTDLAASLETLFPATCRIECPAGLRQRLPGQFGHLQALVQEAVCNAVKHGQARSVTITARRARGRLQLSIRNDGRPLAPGFRRAKGLGLNLMHYRAGALGGILLVADHPEGGVVVRCSLPWEP